MTVTTRPGSNARAELIGVLPPRIDMERSETNGDHERPPPVSLVVVTKSASKVSNNLSYDDGMSYSMESYTTKVALKDFLLKEKIRLMEFCLKKLRSSDDETGARYLWWLDNFLFENVFFADRAERQEAFFQAGGHFLVVFAMKEHPEFKDIQEFGIGVLQKVTSENPSLRTAVAMVGGIQAILDAMKRFAFASDEDIISSGFKALSDICCDHEANSELLVSTELVFLLGRMEAFRDSSSVMNEACQLMWNLSVFAKMKKHIFYANGVSALAAAIDCHKEHQRIQTLAGETIKRLL